MLLCLHILKKVEVWSDVTKNDVFVLNKVKNGPKGPYKLYDIIDQKGLKMYEKRQKNRVFEPKLPAF